MRARLCPVTANTGDGVLIGVGSYVWGVAEDGAGVVGGSVVGLAADGPPWSAAVAAVLVQTGPAMRQWEPADVFSDRERCLAAVRADARRRMAAARKELEAATDSYQTLSQGAA